MDSNTHSARRPAGQPDDLTALEAAVDNLAAQDLTGQPDAIRAERVLTLRRLLDRLEGHWLSELADVDACGAAGADQGIQAASTASWLRGRLRLGAGDAAGAVRTARALFRGPLTATAEALCGGELSAAHAGALVHATHDLAAHVAAEAEPVLVDAARRLDPPRLRRVAAYLRQVADPEGADREVERRHQRRGLWLATTWEGMVALQGLLEPEAGHTVLAALEPLARPTGGADPRRGDQRRADALAELARRSLEAGRLPQTGGVRPQLTVTVDLDSLLDHPGGLGGEVGGMAPLAPEACRRLACDAAVTRVLVTRHPRHHPDPGHHPTDHHGDGPGHHPTDHHCEGPDPEGCAANGLKGRLHAALAVLPPVLGGAPSQPLDVGRTSRVVTPAQRHALAVRDGGCVFPDCDRPLSWCDAHHLLHWLDGGPTDLANLALVCRAHHRAVHEGGWQLTRGPDGHLTTSPPHRQQRTIHRPRHPTAA
jgi:Domain of unknown function (DUF222)